MSLTKELVDLQKELFDFSKRNPFVQVNLDHLWWLECNLDQTKVIEKLYQKSNFYWTEYGLETTLEVALFLKWSPPSDYSAHPVFYISPFLYKPCRIRRSKRIETTFDIRVEKDVYEVNPVIQHYFKTFFDCEVPSEFATVKDGIEWLKSKFDSKNETKTAEIVLVTQVDDSSCWQLIEQKAVGVFNYKKGALGTDYDQLIRQPNQQIVHLLTGECSSALTEKLVFKSIGFLDQSQRMAIETALNRNTLIQGPPGTGKSQVIVNLIAAFLANNKKVLFVSEKRAALEVVSKRLEKKGLGPLIAYFNTQKNQKKSFYEKLNKTWLFLNQHDFDYFSVSQKFHDASLLDFYPKKMTEFLQKLNGNRADLIEILLTAGYDSTKLYTTGHAPDFQLWKENYQFLINFERQLLPIFDVNSIAETRFSAFNAAVFQEKDVVLNLEKRLVDLKATLEQINVVQTNYGLNETIDSFTRLAITASVLNMVDKVQLDLLNAESKKYKAFNTLSKKYQLIKSRLNHAVIANRQWTRKPAISEITELLDLLDQSERKREQSFFRKLKRNPAKLRSSFLDFHSGISDRTKIKLLEGLKLEWRLQGEIDELKVQLKHDLNIIDPDIEIDLIIQLRNKLNAVSQNDYLHLLEHQRSTDLIQDLSKIHPLIVKFNAQKRYLFLDTALGTLENFEDKLDRLEQDLPTFHYWLAELKSYFSLPPSIRHFILQNPKPIHLLNAAVVYANLIDETRFEPHFNQLSGDRLTLATHAFVTVESRLHERTVTEILDGIKGQQNESESLLNKPNFKLNAVQKELKAQFKREKRVVLHEIGKQQRHLSVRQFFEDTKGHLLKIQPLWMMNPLTVSEFLPCEMDLFDVVIFDESSQIPLEDSLPAIYRAKQVVIVGDSNQMPPSSFFSNRDETKTVLDQAQFVFQCEMLQWHYRSKHPDLIRFSNLEFYNGNLNCLPPQFSSKPVEFLFCAGVYSQGCNPIEAHEIARYSKQQTAKSTKKILIVAFSQSQELQIQKALKEVGLFDHPQITTRNLENAQGIESDIVLISVGYGKDEKGDFRMNFGPVNHLNGANRLNVLFTRAIEKMIVFSSIRSDDFGFSENRGVTVLRDFLHFAESLNELKNQKIEMSPAEDWVNQILLINQIPIRFYPAINGLSFTSFIQHETKKILLINPGINEQEVDDLPSLLHVLNQRYLEVKVILSLDIWKNPDRIKQDLLAFFVAS